MTAPAAPTGRLSILAAAFVVARRDFTAILFSRSFFFFLLGPLFPVLVGGLAGGPVGRQMRFRAGGGPGLGDVGSGVKRDCDNLTALRAKVLGAKPADRSWISFRFAVLTAASINCLSNWAASGSSGLSKTTGDFVQVGSWNP